jgi:hypothetical protein
MAIRAAKCIEFKVKEEFSKTGKSRGWAVVGRAAKHDDWDTVKHAGQKCEGYPVRAQADALLSTLSCAT